jgi:plasmid maintenance system antidote protein VapI
MQLSDILSAKDVRLKNWLIHPLFFLSAAPAPLLRGSRNREGMSQHRLAEICGISRRHISEMENGKRAIGKQSAAKIGSALNVDPRMFL